MTQLFGSPHDMEGPLKRNGLIRSGPYKSRQSRIESFEIKKADWVCDLLESLDEFWTNELASGCHRVAYSLLIVSEAQIIPGYLPDVLNARCI